MALVKKKKKVVVGDKRAFDKKYQHIFLHNKAKLSWYKKEEL